MKRLFGTDGIRAVAGEPPLDRLTVRRFGAALGRVVHGEANNPCRVVLGRDTRESGRWLRDAVHDGLASENASAVDSGVISTPGLAHTLRTGGFDAGVMISASHNPYRDNGLKVFDRSGAKLSDAVEKRVEDLILGDELGDPGGSSVAVDEDPSLGESYVCFLEGALEANRFRGMRIVLDCANGSASRIGPEVFRHYGAEVRTIGATPDGKNINLGCGSLHLESLAEVVNEGGYDLGIAFDGDADRALAVDRRGRTIDGDHILYLAARQMKRKARLRGDGIVATILSNLWLERRLNDEGIRLLRCGVGDKYVMEQMCSADLVLGGEQSGHVIFSDVATTGDGILTGLSLVDAILDEDDSLETILDGITPCPQIQLNVRVRNKPDLRKHPAIGPAVTEVERSLERTGRVVLRYSGTEPVARVMVEGIDSRAVREHAERLALLIREQLGA